MDGLAAAHVGLLLAKEREERKLAGAYKTIILATEGSLRPEETEETPERAARAWRELTCGYDVDIEALFKTFPKDGRDEMIAVAGIPFVSLCEHHLLPFTGSASVAYLPSEREVGLSKIPRLVEAYARRLQQQERLTMQIADALQRYLDPIGVAVILTAEHSCMKLRGVRSGGEMRTSVMLGAMRENPETRAEALALLA